MTSTALPSRMGVYGGGRMGAGIAHAFLLAGAEVTVVEVDADAARITRETVVRSLVKAVERGALSGPVDEVVERLRAVADPEELADCDLVVEAVPEDLGLKVEVLTAVERIAPGAVLASNTSALSIDRIAGSLAKADRFLGLHFFNPVPASELVEIVVGARTAPDLTEVAQDWVRALGKTPITVTDSPGFASSRLGVALAVEAIRMLEDGVATAADIDAAMTLGYKHPAGPLRTTDIVGLDVRLAIAEHLAAELGARFEPPTLLRQKVAAGELGRKTGQGFYEWDRAGVVES
ncbi:3-hydroxyacyl-CoA dehydrogenase [Acrocarpospora pleiomorpha]|uniref:3-hydroxyacyl-CoA dehydrogenase n=1 Tax=Acrocarpospora pleiomorpha TaxID=90975 RepID=A0A5M3XDB0_9ACTN|nr:3-hydroxyacyl-CoA dehydrogenase family protein [Acrocarpospora pleiomorpha]GES17521.1 3-hydroxyacyl-CoA dehydrogenase [Acrocarpospora pleiomorpha]